MAQICVLTHNNQPRKGDKIMTVKELVMYDTDTMFKLVDASKAGYFAKPVVLIECDKNVARVQYGNNTVVHFEVTGKRKMTLYIK